MNTAGEIALIGTLAVIWLAAGLLADGLPAARTAAALRQRSAWLSAIVAAGAVMLVSIGILDAAQPGSSDASTAALLAYAPIAVVLTTTVRRLAQVRRGATALITAPQAPVPPGLIAAAAHPLIAAPLQVSGLAALAGLPIAAGLIDVSGSVVAGVVLGAAALAALAILARHALRHSRLSVSAIAPLKRLPRQLAPQAPRLTPQKAELG